MNVSQEKSDKSRNFNNCKNIKREDYLIKKTHIFFN